MQCIIEVMGVALNRYTHRGERQRNNSWIYFLVSTEPDFRGWKLKNERIWVWEAEETVILGFGLSWKSPGRTSDPGVLWWTPLGGGDEVRQGARKVWWVNGTSAAATAGLEYEVRFSHSKVLHWKDSVSFCLSCLTKFARSREICVLFNLKAHHADMLPGAIRSQSPVLVLSRWETLTWDDLRAAIVWVWEQTSCFTFPSRLAWNKLEEILFNLKSNV